MTLEDKDFILAHEYKPENQLVSKNNEINNQNKETKDCDICGIQKIPLQIFNTHLQSKKHKLNSEITSCDICDIKSLTLQAYKKHVKSKTHLLNKKKSIKNSAVHSSKPRKLQTYSLGKFIEEQQELLKFDRKKYKIRIDQMSAANEPYVHKLTCYLSFKLALDPNIMNFSISINDKQYQSYGEIVIKIERKTNKNNDKKRTYAIRCKTVSDLPREVKSLERIGINLETEYECIKMLKDFEDYNKIRFAIFTTCITTEKFSKSTKTKSKSNIKINQDNKSDDPNKPILDNKTSNSEKTEFKYLITSKNISDPINITLENDNIYIIQRENYKSPKLHLYTSQSLIPSRFEDILKKYISDCNVFNAYQKHIENWANGVLGGHYYLTKYDVILKLVEILLEPYIISPANVNISRQNFTKWIELINKVDITLIKNEHLVLSKLCQSFNSTIEKELTTIEKVNKTVNLKDIIDTITDAQLKAYLLEDFSDFSKDIHVTKLYKAFWKADKLPLLLKVDNSEKDKQFITDVITFMKDFEIHKKFIIKTDALLEFKSSIKIFSCAHDITEYVDLNDIKIKYNDAEKLSLKQISKTDMYFLRSISPSMLYDLFIDKCSLKPDPNWKLKNRDVEVIVLSDDIRKDIFKKIYKEDYKDANFGKLSKEYSSYFCVATD